MKHPVPVKSKRPMKMACGRGKDLSGLIMMMQPLRRCIKKYHRKSERTLLYRWEDATEKVRMPLFQAGFFIFICFFCFFSRQSKKSCKEMGVSLLWSVKVSCWCANGAISCCLLLVFPQHDKGGQCGKWIDSASWLPAFLLPTWTII